MDHAHLVWNRCIRLENLQALMRRWRLVRSGAVEGMAHLFPGQGEVFDHLVAASCEAVLWIADSATPLFKVDLVQAEQGTGGVPDHLDALRIESAEESFLALTLRQDALRADPMRACRTFGLTKFEAARLLPLRPPQLFALAHEPSMVLRQSLQWDDFVATRTQRRQEDEGRRSRALTQVAA